MQHNFVFNHLSLPAQSPAVAYELLLDAAKGMLSVGDDGDRFAIYADRNSPLRDIVLSNGYTYNDFMQDLLRRGEEDLHLVLLEVDDKTPMLNFISEEMLNAIAESAFYFPSEPYVGTIDILGVAWNLNAVLLSLSTSPKWAGSDVEFAEFSEVPSTGNAYLPNVSCRDHGIRLREERHRREIGTLAESFTTCRFADKFIEWHDGISPALQARAREKIQIACNKKFAGGKPLFDTLNNADGMRELRFSNIDGGAVRILFKPMAGDHYGILAGFIKKSNNEGYAQAIPLAMTALKELS